jgi:NAD+ synthase
MFALKYLPITIETVRMHHLRLAPSILDLDWQEVTAKITRFIKDYFEKSETEGIIVSLSGGIDSCTVAALSALAIGGNKVSGLMLPEEETWNKNDIKHSRIIAEKFGLRTETIDITPSLEAFYKTIPIFDPSDGVCKGNIKARTRMVYVYYYANRLKMLVCGSSDKSETMMGYFTKWGDIAADISPIMDLYKTQVRKLAHHIGVPKEIIAKPSSPALWPGQLAEKELGIKYEQLDLILYGIEHFLKTEEIAKQLNIEEEFVDKLKHRWLSMEHKRRTLLTAKIEYRTIGRDFRLTRTPLDY